MSSQIEIAGNLYTIKYIHDGEEIFQELQNKKPTFFTYDVETTGLHVKADRPFMGGICFDREVYLFDTTYDILRWFPKWQSCVEFVVGHNICFDLNMTVNVIGEDFLRYGSYRDTMLAVRLSVNAQSERKSKAFRLALKWLGSKFIDPQANHYEILLKKKLRELNKERNAMKKVYLKEVGYTLKALKELEEEEYPSEIIEVLKQWNEDYPSATYDLVPSEILHPYLAVDVILPALLYEKCLNVMEVRNHIKVFEEESKVIPIIVRMARVGMKVDKEYLLKSKQVLKDEIDKLYNELWSYTGDQLKVGQHKKIKEYYLSKGITLAKSDKEHLLEVGDREAKIITRLRTLDKWLGTYVIKILHDSEYDGIFYSMLQPFSAVSGRFSGDSQQFPKDPLLVEGSKTEELYNPRRVFLGEWVFADFSQQELRISAHMVYQLKVEDYNLLRAYMPWRCFHYMTGERYDKRKHNWNEKKPDGSSVWHDENKQVWSPTDLHSATAKSTIQLLGLGITEESNEKEFKQMRRLSKSTNFAKLYGAQAKRLKESLKVSMEVAQALSDGYYKAFPGLKVYADMVDYAMKARGYVENLYGRRYYMSDSREFYIATNLLIQGGAASDLKAKIVRIDDYLVEMNAKTQMVLLVHDEIIFTKVKGEEHIIDHVVKNIMEDSSNLKVPLVSEVETTETCWAEKS